LTHRKVIFALILCKLGRNRSFYPKAVSQIYYYQSLNLKTQTAAGKIQVSGDKKITTGGKKIVTGGIMRADVCKKF
jgi:hypothetical protein